MKNYDPGEKLVEENSRQKENFSHEKWDRQIWRLYVPRTFAASSSPSFGLPSDYSNSYLSVFGLTEKKKREGNFVGHDVIMIVCKHQERFRIRKKPAAWMKWTLYNSERPFSANGNLISFFPRDNK